VTTGSSVFSTLLFHQLIPPREVLRSNLAPDRQYQRTTTTTPALNYDASSSGVFTWMLLGATSSKQTRTVKPIISVGHTDNRISYQCATHTKFYYQCGPHWYEILLSVCLSLFAHKRPSPFLYTYPTKKLFKSVYYQFIEKDFHFGAAVAIDVTSLHPVYRNLFMAYQLVTNLVT